MKRYIMVALSCLMFFQIGYGNSGMIQNQQSNIAVSTLFWVECSRLVVSAMEWGYDRLTGNDAAARAALFIDHYEVSGFVKDNFSALERYGDKWQAMYGLRAELRKGRSALKWLDKFSLHRLRVGECVSRLEQLYNQAEKDYLDSLHDKPYRKAVLCMMIRSGWL